MLRAGIIGAGRISWGYDGGRWDEQSTSFTLASCLNHHAGTQLVAIYDPVTEARNAFKSGYQGQGKVALYDDLDAFLSSGLDLVAIASPSSHHFSHVEACLDASIRQIWVEKPVTLQLADYDVLAKRFAGMELPPRCCVNFVRRGLPEVGLMKEHISSSPDPLEKVSIEVRYSRKLDVNGVHLLDLLGALTGAEQAPPLNYLIPSLSGNPSFGMTLSGMDVKVAGFDLPYHLIELAITDSRGRMMLSDGAARLTWEPKEPNPHHEGFFKLGAPVGIVGMNGDLKGAALNILDSLVDGDSELIAPLGSARFSQELMERVLNHGSSTA